MDSSISMMSKTAGDEVVIEWDSSDPKQQKAAEKAFQKLRDKGVLLFQVQAQEHVVVKEEVVNQKVKGVQIHDLPASGGRIVGTPAFAGG